MPWEWVLPNQAVVRYVPGDLLACHYREMLLSGVERRFGKLSLRDLLEPAVLRQIFASGTLQ